MFLAAGSPSEWREALSGVVNGHYGAWNVLRFASNVHPPNRPFQGGCACRSVVQVGGEGGRQLPVLCEVGMEHRKRRLPPRPFDRAAGASSELTAAERDADVEAFDVGTECKAMSSAAYAVDGNTFERYLSALETVRGMCANRTRWEP